MTAILAKPVIANRYWILTKDNLKVGAVEAEPDGYTVRIRGHINKFKTLRMLRQQVDIDFCTPEKPAKPVQNQVHGFDTGCRAHNAMWHVQHRLPLFTKTAKSRSWYAAGWYAIKQHRSWQITHNPKLIVLERYAFQGPFHSREQAHAQALA